MSPGTLHRNSESAVLPQRVLLVENSRTFTSMLREAIEQRVELPVTVVSTLAEAARVLDEEDGWFLVLTGLVLVDGDRDKVVEFFLSRNLPTVVVSGVYDEDLRQRVLQQQIIDYVLKNAPGSIEYLAWLVQRLERNRRIGALVVDDSLSARTYAAALLSMYGYRVVLAADGAAGLEAIERDPGIRLTIVDQEMPGMEGVEFTRRLRALRSRDKVAVIGISGNSDSSLIPRFLKNGANDFLRKPFSREEFFCRVSQNVDQLELIGTLQDLATRDFLTGLPNRRYFLEQSQRVIPQLLSQDQTVTAAMLDIDHFKHINDTWGHEAGDQALRAVAASVSGHARPQDLVARFGGEEFCLLVPGLDAANATSYFETLRERISALRVRVGDDTLSMTVSIGVCIATESDQSLHHLLNEADKHLYLAKAGGRNQVRLAS
ncbi:diguanylate cyclase [Xanthomonas vesicatoria]|uniref:diguanylate cyclase n=1 Tax=Xanthomonas vesicatoria TaxID=56460 RepID=A0AAJ0N2P3_9XANT|nr:diguanylate cyclase [Xanthomonas vesicatoria]APO94226.1 diguanylate cyclase response regulator [Xanthomonas vesicatoria]APP74455.1 diguanylate cyclase response regulator [Xanthomonas vesicatoria ATCC 35937]KHM90776.1 diguanylate cyclase [Xanthomonas vesicatoria]KHM90892.1 diguanylate cyclase [Xanthomonas vesicatoria]KTF33508.1 diguanylate cyclase [Xanthomonas vesicatoria]